ncbi:MAG: hypothetical protein ABFS86_10725 [Planctomycetota bacterium]
MDITKTGFIALLLALMAGLALAGDQLQPGMHYASPDGPALPFTCLVGDPPTTMEWPTGELPLWTWDPEAEVYKRTLGGVEQTIEFDIDDEETQRGTYVVKAGGVEVQRGRTHW